MESTGDKGEGKALPWTEEDKFQLLVRIVAQLRGESGRPINWQKVNMPNRTIKSMQNMWTKINKTIAEVEQEAGDTPIKRPTPRKRRSTKSISVVDQDEDELATPTKTPQKRKAKSAGGSAKKVKAEVDVDGDDEIVFKGEPEADDAINLEDEPEVDEDGCGIL